MSKKRRYSLSWGNYQLTFGKRTCVMGILNVTPDSFSDGGQFLGHETAVAHGEKMVEDGADILDIGGESTRPYADAVSEDEEIRRVVPVIAKLAPRIQVPISIDTTKARVAQRAIDAGAAIINDVGALRLDPQMAQVASRAGIPVIIMHMLGTPRTMQDNPVYENLIDNIRQFLSDTIALAVHNGISRSKLIIDPGIGFGKTVNHNLLLIRHLSDFSDLDLPILVGTSRKAFIRKVLASAENDAHEPSPDQPVVEIGTQASVCAAILNGAHIVRSHNVANTRATADIADAIMNAR